MADHLPLVPPLKPPSGMAQVDGASSLCGGFWLFGKFCGDASGDMGEGSELFLAEHGKIIRLIGRIVDCRATAEDLVQDVFVKLWDRMVVGQFHGNSSRSASWIDHILNVNFKLTHYPASHADVPHQGFFCIGVVLYSDAPAEQYDRVILIRDE